MATMLESTEAASPCSFLREIPWCDLKQLSHPSDSEKLLQFNLPGNSLAFPVDITSVHGTCTVALRELPPTQQIWVSWLS